MVRNWMHRDTESLDEAERLVLEDHLESCASCRVGREQLLLVRKLGASLPATSIGPRGHQRAIARALMQGRSAPTSQRATLRWWAFGAGAGAFAAAALAAFLAFRSGGAVPEAPDSGVAPAPEQVAGSPVTATQKLATPPEADDSGLTVLGGTLVRGETALAIDSRIPAEVVLRAATDVRLSGYRMNVVVGASGEIRRSSVERALLLDRGRLEIDGASMRIVTDSFSIDATGTVTVTTRRVAVRRGTARVLAPDGRLLAVVEAGQTWNASDARASTKTSAAALLEQARSAFTRKDYALAERHADAALDAAPARTQAAEARTILAECAQASGRLDEALARYEAIATRFADLPAGETALFAAVQLEATRNHRDAARSLARRYLDQYPSGRFADDARRQLRAPR